MEELCSHPQKLLVNHLLKVATIANAVVSDEGFNFSLPDKMGITPKQLTDLVWIAGAFHDLAKATSYFQEYIRNPEGTHNHLKNHAQLSSIFAYYVAKRYCSLEINNKSLAELFPYLVLIAVKRHHGNIENLERELLFDDAQIENLSTQIQNIDSIQVEPIIHQLLANIPVNATWKEFVEFGTLKPFNPN